MAEGFITRKGGVAATKAPSLNFVSKTDSEIVFTITNNDDATVDVFWEVGDNTPDANQIELTAGQTSSNQTASGLTQNTQYTIFAFANKAGKAGSATASLTATTDDIPIPQTISNLYVWADASQITGLSNNDPVATWSDLSGNNFDLTQGTSSKRPVYLTNQLNGLPVLSFDGVDDSLTNLFGTTTRFNTYFVVYKYDVAPSTGNYMVFDGNDANNRQIFYSSNGILGMWAGDFRPTFGTTSTNWEYASLIFNDSSSFGRLSGVQSGTADPGTRTMDGISLMAHNQETQQASNYTNGKIAEFIMYNRILTTQEIQDIENYLTSKWGL